MENSKVNLIRSELDMAASYIERLFHGIIDLSDLDFHPELKKVIKPYYQEIFHLLNEQFFQNILNDSFRETSFSVSLFREWVLDAFKTLEMVSRLGINTDQLNVYIDIINCGYRLGRELHLFCLRETDLVVELPRTVITSESSFNAPVIDQVVLTDNSDFGIRNFLQTDDSSADGRESLKDENEVEDDWNELTLPLYQVREENIASCEFGGSILSYSMGVLKKSKELINKGHECVFEKKYSNALVFFERSRRLHESAEILTLIGWVYSLLNNLERGKKFCLKAIEVDPDYGPAYNDIGSYLLQEGDISESIRWFNLAKNAPIYHNKEYPYINMGRAFLMQKKYQQALDEFKVAKKLAPHQKQITETIKKVESLLAPTEKKTDVFDDFSFLQRSKSRAEFEPEFQ